MALGTHGDIRFQRAGGRSWRARTRFRDRDGVLRDVERTGPTKAPARDLLKLALRDRVRIDAAEDFHPDTR